MLYGQILEDASDENEELLVKDCPEDQTKPMKVLPMFAMLPSHLQQKVFDRVPEGTRYRRFIHFSPYKGYSPNKFLALWNYGRIIAICAATAVMYTD